MANGKHPREMNKDEQFEFQENLYYVVIDFLSFLMKFNIYDTKNHNIYDIHDFLNRQMQRLIDE